MNYLYYIFIIIILTSCGDIEFSPNQKFDSNTPSDLNIKNVAKLQSQARDDTIRFVLTGDTQRAYSACKDMVQKINTMQGVDFVLIDGDISDFGLYQEMKWIHTIYSGLSVPYIGVLGNHDIAANGKQVFGRMYGPENFCFVYDSVKFVCHDTNSREYNFSGNVPNISWLKEEMQAEPGINGFVAVSHVSCFDADFDQNLTKDYISTLLKAPKFLASLNAHINTTEVLYPYDGKTPFIAVNNAAKKEFLLIDIIHGKLLYKVIRF